MGGYFDRIVCTSISICTSTLPDILYADSDTVTKTFLSLLHHELPFLSFFLFFFLLTQTRKNQLFVFVNLPCTFPDSLLLYRAHTHTYTSVNLFFCSVLFLFWHIHIYKLSPSTFFLWWTIQCPPLFHFHFCSSQSIGSADWLGVHVYTAFIFFLCVLCSCL